ncbi:MAG: DNA polymerase III subunit gamma/tau [Clostridiales bacterium]|jgi:DNA polymerase-3 subunit gamma/tau|nr:DNA polymerase III subunit gamma/tau [Clostridiales bacterium]
MAYMALYRKLRPRNFSEVLGQRAIVRTLKNQLSSGRVSHAYLFCGTRGTGKTSVAKIFARAVNCLDPRDGEPCGVCRVCVDILERRSVNVVEIDAASNNGVDNIRDIREEVKYPPTEGKYRVYIIDEVHMLSTGAFNALLKTLEEPPEHIIFILATTDPQKLPATILSRCQRYDFRRVGAGEQTAAMRAFIDSEGLNVTDEALRYIADISDGAMRDALSLLDQCISFYADEGITLEKVLALTGAVDPAKFFEFTEFVASGDSASAIETIQRLVMDGRDISQFVADMIQHFRNLMVAAAVEKRTAALDYSPERVQRYREQGRKIPNYLLISFVNNFSLLQNQIKYAANPRVLLEVAVIKLCSPAGDENLPAVFARMSQMEEKLRALEAARIENPPAAAPTEPPKPISPPTASKEKAVPEDIQNVIKHWLDFINCFDNALKGILRQCKVGYLEGGILQIVCTNTGSKDYLTSKQNIIKDNLSQNYHKEFNLSFSLAEDYEAEHKRLYGKKDLFEDIQSKINMKIEEWE